MYIYIQYHIQPPTCINSTLQSYIHQMTITFIIAPRPEASSLPYIHQTICCSTHRFGWTVFFFNGCASNNMSLWSNMYMYLGLSCSIISGQNHLTIIGNQILCFLNEYDKRIMINQQSHVFFGYCHVWPFQAPWELVFVRNKPTNLLIQSDQISILSLLIGM
jgi:hypothetical protein